MLISDEPNTKLVVLMFTDLAGSVDLKTRLGASTYAKIISKHDHLFKDILATIPGAVTIKDTGDGFLAKFETTSDAVRAALRFQYVLSHETWDPEPARVRIGLHIGQVSELEKEEATGLPKIVGLAADIAARIMDLAVPGQILMSRTLFDDARQYIREHPPVNGEAVPEVKWLAHGPYLFKGADEPMDVFEVGAVGIAPLKEPPDSGKARRAVRPGEEELLGWRPGAGLDVPSREGWKLEKKLGEGGFGEVWLARHHRTKESRVFKFCYDPDRLRSFKREMTLFRLLREALGTRDDIVRLYDVRLDQPPFFLESAYSPEGDLKDWAQRQGGIAKVPMQDRIDIVAGIADALAAAHSVGVLHKDVKPANVLIRIEGTNPRPVLADFGIGMIGDMSELEARNITMTGFTETMMDNESSRTGTRLYAPPELLTGKPFTVQGDIFALGVLLYQMVVGDLSRPLAHGWETQIEDPILRGDIAAAVAGNMDERLKSASELAVRIRTLDARRQERKRQQRVHTTRIAVAVLAALLAVSTLLILYERSLRNEATEQRDLANKLKGEAENARQKAEEHFRLSQDRLEKFQLEKASQAAPTDLPRATLWFAEAMKTDLQSAEPDPSHRLRMGAALGQTPTLRWLAISDYFAEWVSHSRDGRYVFLTSAIDGLLFDAKTGKKIVVPFEDSLVFNDIALTGDASSLAVLLKDGSYQVLDARTGKARIDPVPHSPVMQRITLSDDGSRAVLTNYGNVARLIDARNGTLIREVPCRDSSVKPQLSPDGSRLLTIDSAYVTHLWNGQSGEEINEPKLGNFIRNARFSPDSAQLALVDWKGDLWLLDARTLAPIGAGLPMPGEVRHLDFDLKSHTLAAVCAPPPTAPSPSLYATLDVVLIDTLKGTERTTAIHQEYSATSYHGYQLAPGGQLGATAFNHRFLSLRAYGDATSSFCTLQFDRTIIDLCFYEDAIVAVTSDGVVRVLGLDDEMRPLLRLSHHLPPDPNFLPTGGIRTGPKRTRTPDLENLLPDDTEPRPKPNTFDLLDPNFPGQVAPGNPAPTPRLPVDDDWPSPFALGSSVPPGLIPGLINVMEVSEDGNKVLTASWDKTVRLWDAATGKALYTLRHPHRPSSAHMSRDQKRVLTVCRDGARLWTLGQGEPQAIELKFADAKVEQAAMNHAGDRIALSCTLNAEGDVPGPRQCIVRMIDAITAKPAAPDVAIADSGRVQFSPDDQRLLITGPSIHLLDLRAGRWIVSMSRSHSLSWRNSAVVWSPANDCFALTRTDNHVQLHDVKDGRPKARSMEHDETVTALAFNRTGSQIATAGGNGVRVWDARTGEPKTILISHQARVVSVAFDHTGRYIASCDQSGRANIWTADSGDLVASFHGHRYDCQFASFSPDGKRLIVAAGDEVSIWPLVATPLSIDELLLTAEVNAASFIDETGTVRKHSIESLRRTFDALQARRKLRSP
ncbi:MAG: protein kinase [Phycisphaeraceae bacterium]